ncbi:MAG: 50S ribosomal protein L25 [Elusimicrobiota bacterium]
MEKIELNAELRTELSKGRIKQLRASGKIPAVLYGSNENITLTINANQFVSLVAKAGYNAIINLLLPDKSAKTVLIKEIQKNVVTRKISHIDFYLVSMEKKIEVAIPVVLVGESPGVKAGGVCDHIIRELKIKCLPTEIPEKISVDISNLETGQTVLVKDLILPENIELLVAADQIVVNIVSPTILEEVAPGAPVETAGEPEVIGKGKKVEEEEVELAAEGKPVEPKKEIATPKKEEKPEKK